jgi:DNA-binding NarL/FixJ family response regulator
MNDHTSATATSELLTATTHADGDQHLPIHLVYEMATTDWTRQARAFVRSLQAYQDVTRLQSRRLSRASRDAMTDVPARVVTVPPEIGTAPPPDAPAPTTADTCPLTRRQFEIAELISEGLSNDQIAQRLILTRGTVGNHVGHILRRLGARNRAQVARWVTQAATPLEARDGRRS